MTEYILLFEIEGSAIVTLAFSFRLLRFEFFLEPALSWLSARSEFGY
jgi:hypothetical protein